MLRRFLCYIGLHDYEEVADSGGDPPARAYLCRACDKLDIKY